MQQQLLLQLAPPPAPTLDNFVPGRNGAALRALREIAAGAAAERFVYLWGEPGSGRTHLLRGLAQAAGARGSAYFGRVPDAGIAADRVYAVDDVQCLAPDDQIRLFDLYNRVRAGGGALVAGGDAAPGQLALRADLRSRLAWGLAFQLHPLSDGEKTDVLRAHAQALSLDLAEDVLAYLLRHARRDMASLIGIVDALDRYSLEQKRPVTLPLVRSALDSINDRSA